MRNADKTLVEADVVINDVPKFIFNDIKRQETGAP